MVNLLLNNSADKNSKDNNGRTLLSVAAKLGNLVEVELLLNRRTNGKSKDSSGQTPLSLVVQYGQIFCSETTLRQWGK